jgi:hypothetical protein
LRAKAFAFVASALAIAGAAHAAECPVLSDRAGMVGAPGAAVVLVDRAFASWSLAEAGPPRPEAARAYVKAGTLFRRAADTMLSARQGAAAAGALAPPEARLIARSCEAYARAASLWRDLAPERSTASALATISRDLFFSLEGVTPHDSSSTVNELRRVLTPLLAHAFGAEHTPEPPTVRIAADAVAENRRLGQISGHALVFAVPGDPGTVVKCRPGDTFQVFQNELMIPNLFPKLKSEFGYPTGTRVSVQIGDAAPIPGIRLTRIPAPGGGRLLIVKLHPNWVPAGPLDAAAQRAAAAVDAKIATELAAEGASIDIFSDRQYAVPVTADGQVAGQPVPFDWQLEFPR